MTCSRPQRTAPGRARTRDPLVRNPTAFPLRQSAPSDEWMKNESLVLKLKKKIGVKRRLMELLWPRFVNQGLYIPKRLFLSVGSKTGSCQFFFSFSRSRSQVKNVIAFKLMVSMIVSCFLVDILRLCSLNPVMSKVNTLR